MNVRIVVGMSGGVDSSLVAVLLKNQGHDVIGVTLRLYDYKQSLKQTSDDKKHCHPDSFIHGAQKVCDDLQVPHHVMDRRDFFQERIVDSFTQSYRAGKTPLPCVTCNRDVKTSALYDTMKDLGAEALATGHYVRRIDVGDSAQMHQGTDVRRDQSFFLFALTEKQMNVMHFPLGGYSKQETRDQAEKLGLSVAQTPASQDLCFIADRSYRSLFKENPGPIQDETGHVLGQHRGIEHYTVGQRQGLGLGGHHAEPMYVIGLDAQHNVVIVGPRDRLARTIVHLNQVNWLARDLCSGDEEQSTYVVSVKMRSSSIALPATVTIAWHNRTAKVTLESPDYSISPGQACVFYQGTRLLGGGWII